MSAEQRVPRHPGVFQRPNGSYTARVKGPDGKQHRVTGSTIAEVKAARAKLQTDLANGSHFAESRTPFRVYAREWIDTYEGRTERGIRTETKREYRKILEQFAIPFFGSQPLCEITAPRIKQYQKSLADHVVVLERGGKTTRHPAAARTVRARIGPVKALFATAAEDGLIVRNPCAHVRIKVKRADELAGGEDGGRTIRALDDAELARLIEATPPEWRLLIEVLAQAGLRISEGLALQWGDVDGQQLHIRRRLYRGNIGEPKSKYGKRSIPLSRSLATALWQARKDARWGADTDPIFCTTARPPRDADTRQQAPAFYNDRNLFMRVMKPAAKSAGVPWAGFHTLRHTCATRLFRAGVNVKAIQLWMGHHSPAFTLETYVHLLPKDMPESPFEVGGNPIGNLEGTRPAQTSGLTEQMLEPDSALTGAIASSG